eukprot:SAG22_NODE_341_length_11992_cov_180.308753_11_plen_77_part_00
MAKFGDAGEDRLNGLLSALYSRVVEAVRRRGGDVVHLHRDRIVCCFADDQPMPPTMVRRGGGEYAARVKVVVLEAR